jgi:hypothetical protein
MTTGYAVEQRSMPEYADWFDMIRSCYDPTYSGYLNSGADPAVPDDIAALLADPNSRPVRIDLRYVPPEMHDKALENIRRHNKPLPLP